MGRLFDRAASGIISTKLLFKKPVNKIESVAIWCPHGPGDFCMLLPHLIEFCIEARQRNVAVTVYTSTVGIQELREKSIPDGVVLETVGQDWTGNMRPLHLRRAKYDLLICSYYFTDIALLPIAFMRFRGHIGMTPSGTLRQKSFPAVHWHANAADVRMTFCGIYETARAALAGRSPDLSDEALRSRLAMLDTKYFSVDKNRPRTLVLYGRYFKRTSKYYPLDRYRALSSLAKKQLAPQEIVLLLGKADEDALMTDELALLETMQHEGVTVVRSDDIASAGALLRKTRWFVGPDGGGTHLAVLFGVPCILSFFEKGIRPEHILPPFHAKHSIYRESIAGLMPDELVAALVRLETPTKQ